MIYFNLTKIVIFIYGSDFDFFAIIIVIAK